MAHRHLVVLWQVIAAAWAGALLSDLIFYYLGRRFQTHPTLRRIMERPKFKRVMARLNKGPSSFAAVFRFIPGMRMIGPVALAQSQISTGRFTAIAGAAALIWAAFFSTIGHAVGRLVALLIGDVREVGYLLIVPGIVLAVMCVYALWTFVRRRQAGTTAAR